MTMDWKLNRGPVIRQQAGTRVAKVNADRIQTSFLGIDRASRPFNNKGPMEQRLTKDKIMHIRRGRSRKRSVQISS